MSKKVAVIASMLKPVNDTRMYEKLGLSIRESNKYQVNIIGFRAKFPAESEGLSFHTLYSGSRISISRLMAPFKFLGRLFKLKPDLVIVCTPELLWSAMWYKTITTTRLWYDVQENYQRNVKHQQAYPVLVKPFLMAAIATTEWCSRPFIDRYLLAEKGYLKELPFVNKKYTILENKYLGKPQAKSRKKSNGTVLAFTGTCSPENGIMEAISLALALHRHQYPITLTITGHIPSKQTQVYIEKMIAEGCPIELSGNGSLVPHSAILEAASQADFGLVAHRPNPSNENCIPTKLYEYLGLDLPMILQSHALWESVVDPYSAAVVVDYENIDPDDLWYRMHNTRFYDISPGSEISWESEAQKLLPLL